MKFHRQALIATALISILSCSAEDEPQKPSGGHHGNTGGSDEHTTNVYPISGEGWDIFTGKGYRYGASIIINDDKTYDMWLAAPGGRFTDGTKTYISDKQVPYQMGTDNTFAQSFEFSKDFCSVGVFAPSWSSKDECFTLSMYKWNTDYKTTLNGKPLATRRFEKYADNSWLYIYAGGKEDGSEKFPAGKYMWVMSEGTPNAGLWMCPDKGAAEGTAALSYVNGTDASGQFFSMICEKPCSGHLYWDKIVYMRSLDGGKSWQKEQDALIPTDYSRDALSCCDPGVAFWGGYYYLGYTSTENQEGKDNHLYMARATSPAGPWEKWNGTGWGGDKPQPIVTYNGNPKKFGAGEPCMIVIEDKLYLYYSWNDDHATTRLSTAPASDPLWPSKLEDQGTVIDKEGIPKPDHSDIKYIEETGMFLAIHAADRNTDNSYIMMWESSDGINFREVGRMQGTFEKGIMNAGLTGDALGHIRKNDRHFICYAHSDAPRQWGEWYTWWSPLTYK